MKWFVHETTASEDVKIVRLELEHGISGYAVFFKLLELVGREGDDSESLWQRNSEYLKTVF
jgi:hypothetical protein